MKTEYTDILMEKCGESEIKKLESINNPELHEFITKYVELCDPAGVFIRTDAPEDAEYIRNKALENGEEQKLRIEGHSIHFDGYYDQARDKSRTKYLLEGGEVLGPDINSEDREKGLAEVHEYLKGAMKGKEMYIGFFCLGPVNSPFSVSAVQITDSSYVVHSEGILYRSGYEQFKKLGSSPRFFRFVHTAGELEGSVSKNVDKRRVYIDLQKETVFSTNTQYAGNTVGLKKLSMRLAIKRASEEGWLTEHMFLMGVKNSDGTKKTYFTGAFPSACGKTATAMLEGENIVGDDIVYIRKIDGKLHAVNVESGIFGIIRDVNDENDPAIYKALTTPGEVIFSNVLKNRDNDPRWLEDGRPMPEGGLNFSGEWVPGKKGPDGKDVPHAHKNARYTIRIKDLENNDENLNTPEGVEIGGIIYGGRDSDTSMPVVQSFDWGHGILTQASCIESETTAATLGAEGVRTFNPMSNLDFLSIPIGKYIENNLSIVNGLEKKPLIFHVNYFLKGADGKFLNGIKDKHVWLKWMEKRVNGEAEAIKTPVGYIPEYEDLALLFKEVRGEEYTEEQYGKQFKLRIPELMAKIARMEEIYKSKVADAPEALFGELDAQKKRLELCAEKYGDYVSPSDLK